MIKKLHPHPALLLNENGEKHLIISDPHIGFEERFSSSGVMIESSSRMMLDSLNYLIGKVKPDDVIILGDVKDSIDSINRTERIEVPKFLESLLSSVDVRIVPGNHDGGIRRLVQKDVKIEDVHGVRIGNVALSHGHTRPPDSFAGIDRYIMGHLHPTYNRSGVALSGIPVWLILKASGKYIFGDSYDNIIEIIVVPSFNRELSGIGFTSNRGRIISPVIRMTRPNLEDAIIMTLDGDVIGNKNSVQYII